MNAGSSHADDFQLVSTGADFSTSAPRIAQVQLRVFDYGGETEASVEAGGQEDTVRIPLEHTPGNKLPDAGWVAWTAAGGESVAGSGDYSDDDESTAGNPFHGDGLNRFDEYRGFVHGGVHKRLNPSVKDLFVYSDFNHVGYATNLPLRIWVMTNRGEIGPERHINFNSSWTTYAQRALSILDFDTQPGVPLLGGTPGLERPVQQPPYGPNSVTGDMLIYTYNIRLRSPPDNDQTENDPYDDWHTRKTLAHEIGHALNLPHVMNLNPSCSGGGPIPMTVMVEGASPQTEDQGHSCWNIIPTNYLSSEIAQIRLR